MTAVVVIALFYILPICLVHACHAVDRRRALR